MNTDNTAGVHEATHSGNIPSETDLFPQGLQLPYQGHTHKNLKSSKAPSTAQAQIPLYDESISRDFAIYSAYALWHTICWKEAFEFGRSSAEKGGVHPRAVEMFLPRFKV